MLQKIKPHILNSNLRNLLSSRKTVEGLSQNNPEVAIQQVLDTLDRCILNTLWTALVLYEYQVTITFSGGTKRQLTKDNYFKIVANFSFVTSIEVLN